MRITTAAALTAAMAAVAFTLPATAHANHDGTGSLFLCIAGPSGLKAEVFASGSNDGDNGSETANVDNGGANIESGLLTVPGTTCTAEIIEPAGGYLASVGKTPSAVYPNVECNAGLPCPAKLIGWRIQSTDQAGTDVIIPGPVAHFALQDNHGAPTFQTRVTAIFGYDPAAD